LATFRTNIVKEIERLPDHKVFGRVTDVVGMLVEAGGVQSTVSVGDHCDILARNGRRVRCEVIGFSNNRALLMPFSSVDGVGMGCRVEISSSDPVIYPDISWLGRVINAFGEQFKVMGKNACGACHKPFREKKK